MRDIHHHYYIFPQDVLERHVEEALSLLQQINGKVNAMSAALDRLKASVANINEKSDSIVALVMGLAQQIRDLKGDEAALVELADTLDREAGELAEAVAANTEPAPPA